MVLMMSMRRSPSIRHAPGATEKRTTRSERSKRILGALRGYLVVVVGLVVTVLGIHRVLRASLRVLLLEASDKVPEGSGVVHVCNGWHCNRPSCVAVMEGCNVSMQEPTFPGVLYKANDSRHQFARASVRMCNPPQLTRHAALLVTKRAICGQKPMARHSVTLGEVGRS